MEKFFLAAVCAVFSCMVLTARVEARTTDQQYKDIAYRIINEIKSLKSEYKHFARVEKDSVLEDRDDVFWVAFDYENGMKVKAGRDGEEIKVFSKSRGVDVTIYFYKGAWGGKGEPVRPISIGDLNVLVYVQGEDTEAIKEIRVKVGQIVLKEKTDFEKNEQ